MSDVLVWAGLVAALGLTFGPLVLDLVREFRDYSPDAARIPSDAPSDPPEGVIERGPSGRHASCRRVPSPAGTWHVTVPAGGPDTRHRGPVCD